MEYARITDKFKVRTRGVHLLQKFIKGFLFYKFVSTTVEDSDFGLDAAQLGFDAQA